ncbi:hypothetical protein R1flu_011137 [Riccia fluitans]|uniref:Uncharacterized protein n=1 Tax=Riccia fluitans TaxID=41844 RepID=A0ABD1Z7R1_9MARC
MGPVPLSIESPKSKSKKLATRLAPLRIGSQARDDSIPTIGAGGQSVDRASGQATQVVSIPDPMAMMRSCDLWQLQTIELPAQMRRRRSNGKACPCHRKGHKRGRPGQANQTRHQVHQSHLRRRKGAARKLH